MTGAAAVVFGTAAYAQLQRPNVEPIPITAEEMLSGKFDYKFVRIHGTIQDLFHDDNNSLFRFFIIDSDDETIFAPSMTITESDAELEKLIGAEVSVCGTCDRTQGENSPRQQFRRNLYIWRLDDISVVKPAPATPFDVPPLENLTNVRPSEVPRHGRRRVIGRVLAVWDGIKVLLEDAAGKLTAIEPKRGPAPEPGEFIEAAGLPESNIYRINLNRAVWRPAAPFACTDQPVADVSAQTILTDQLGKPGIKPQFHGRLIRLTGIIRSLPQQGTRRFYLQDGSHLVPVDTTCAPLLGKKLVIGAKVALTGICVTEVEPWRPGSVFPRTNGFVLVPRGGDPVEILSTPPWWTPGKLFGVIGALAVLLVATIIWNRSLSILAERRGRTLLREQIGRVKNQLKIGERTRLSVELHDSLSQSLTGIAFEIKAARNLAHTDPQTADRHLDFAARTLQFCRTELKNCLWELRSQTLEATRMEDAIRQTLQPHLGGATLNIRFNVPRHRISDNTAHALLRIIRELVSNAVRHGHATQIRIAGALDGERLDFSVTDNGCGFDPERYPGASEGHFGLQGVHERVVSQGGFLTIHSHPGEGTRIAASLMVRTPEEEKQEEEKR